jgi:hypothetical protein
VPNFGAPNFIKHTILVLETQIDSNTAIVGDVNTHLSSIGHPDKDNINFGIEGHHRL